MKTQIHFLSYFAQFFVEWETLHTKVSEEIKTHTMFNNLFYWESCHLRDNVNKYCGAKQAPYDNKGQDHCILDS